MGGNIGKKDIHISLIPGEELVAVLELEEKEVPAIILTNERLIIPADLSDAVELGEDSDRADRFANRVVSSVQSRLHKGLGLEKIRDIRIEGRNIVVRAKLRRFMPTVPITVGMDDPNINMGEVEAFIEEVRKQIDKLRQKEI